MMLYFDSHIQQSEYPQLVYCPKCRSTLHITVQNRRGSHGCECGGQMEVWEPRPDRLGGLLGEEPKT
jgi:hypothetical protein